MEHFMFSHCQKCVILRWNHEVFLVLHCQKCAFGNASALSCIGEPNSLSKICKPRNDAFSSRTVNKRGNGKRHPSSALSNMFDVSSTLSKSNTVRNVISQQSLIPHALSEICILFCPRSFTVEKNVFFSNLCYSTINFISRELLFIFFGYIADVKFKDLKTYFSQLKRLL
jgi:hypothetical protein